MYQIEASSHMLPERQYCCGSTNSVLAAAAAAVVVRHEQLTTGAGVVDRVVNDT